MRRYNVILMATCFGMCLLSYFNVYFLQQHEREWNDDVHLKHHYSHHLNENALEPLDAYLKYFELPTTMLHDCNRTSPIVTNTSLSYLLDLKTPCSTSGKEHCVVVFSLFCSGTRHPFHRVNSQCEKYTSHLHNLHGWKAVFEGWELRIYTDDSVPFHLLDPYRDIANIITVNDSLKGTGTWGSMWRLLPLWDDSVDRFISRDVDSVPLVRDWATTYEWIRLGHSSYKWADHANHYSHPILTGALGMTKTALTSIQRNELLDKFQKMPKFFTSKYGDQEWLASQLYPLLREDMLTFNVQCSSGGGEYSNSVRPFPVPHSQCDWIMGGPDFLFGERDEVDGECRHSNHPTWKWG